GAQGFDRHPALTFTQDPHHLFFAEFALLHLFCPFYRIRTTFSMRPVSGGQAKFGIFIWGIVKLLKVPKTNGQGDGPQQERRGSGVIF
ncbi:MAG: hypothetical protein PHD76_12460, partial [Methylacidiphilales bacterium]|nr:hypothetical protein [Candidatus Methylacidiphilales bacterium]